MNRLNSDPEHPKAPTIDHIIPRAAKKGIVNNNVRMACRGCNNLRSQHNTQYWETLKKRVEETKSDLEKLEEQNKKLTELLVRYLDQPWYRKFYVRFFRFVEFLKERKYA